MSKLVIEWTPEGSEGVPNRAEAATWAQLRVEVLVGTRHHVLTRVLDRQSKTVRNEVYGTVLPLAEWFAATWPFMTASRRAAEDFDDDDSRYGWERFRRWRYIGQGAAVPDVMCTSLADDTVQLAWQADAADDAYQPVEFTGCGVATVPMAAMCAAIEEFVESVLARLRAEAPDDPRTAELAEVWAGARDATHPDHTATVLSAKLGLDWWNLPRSERDALREFADRAVTNPFVTTMCDAVQPSRLDDAERTSRAFWEACQARAEPQPDEWFELRASVGKCLALPRQASPWRRGWAAAEALRQVLNVEPDSPFTEELLGIEKVVRQEVMSEAGDRIDGAVGWAAAARPVQFQPAGQAPRAFDRCRAVHALLFEGKLAQAHATVFARRVLGLNSVANAFAAELLAPVELLRSRLVSMPRMSQDDVAALAQEIGAPFLCVRHQIENHALASLRPSWEA